MCEILLENRNAGRSVDFIFKGSVRKKQRRIWDDAFDNKFNARFSVFSLCICFGFRWNFRANRVRAYAHFSIVFCFFFFFAMINKRENFVSQDRWFFLAEITSNICTWQLSHSQHIICSRSSKFIKYFRVYDRDELFMCPPIEIAIFNAQTTLFRSFSFVCRSIKVFQLRFRSQRNILTCHRSTWLWWCVMRGWNSLG